MEDKPTFTSEEEKRIREIVLSVLREHYAKALQNVSIPVITIDNEAAYLALSEKSIGDHVHRGV